LKKFILIILSMITLFSTISPGFANETTEPTTDVEGIESIYDDTYDDLYDGYDDDYIPDGWYDPDYGPLDVPETSPTPDEAEVATVPDEEEENEAEELLPISRQATEAVTTIRQTAVITRNDVSMHESSNTSSAVIRTLSANTYVRITGRLGNMYRIRHNNTTGWITQNNVVRTRQIAIPRENNVPVRASRNENAPILTTVNRGQRLTITRRNGTWSRVTVNNQTGWIRNNQLSMTNARRPGRTTAQTALHSRPDANSNVRRTLPANQEFMIIQRTTNGSGAHNGWTQIRINDNGTIDTGWIRTNQVSRENQYRRITGGSAPLRTGPSASFDRIISVNTGTEVRVLAEVGSWSHVRVRANGRNDLGWISTARLTTANDLFDDLLAYGRQYLGWAWTAGGNNPNRGFDCSGYIQWIYSVHGINLPRTAQQQYNSGTAVARSDVRPGDLAFFQGTYASNSRITHVGMYVGGGRMLHVGSTGGVQFSAATSGWWGNHFAGFRRVIN